MRNENTQTQSEGKSADARLWGGVTWRVRQMASPFFFSFFLRVTNPVRGGAGGRHKPTNVSLGLSEPPHPLPVASTMLEMSFRTAQEVLEHAEEASRRLKMA